MGPFPGNERTWKPFNPILGETFELTMDNGLRFIAEQVCSCSAHSTENPHEHCNLQQLHLPLHCSASHAECCITAMNGSKYSLTISMTSKHVSKWHVQVSHHPPVGAAHAENKDWEYDMVSAPTTKFLGNSIDIYPIGWPFGYQPCIIFAFCHLSPHKLCYVMSATIACALSST